MIVPARFNGPPDSANGGYTCGLVAAALGAGPVEVSLRSPPPLNRELVLDRRRGGGATLRDGETVLADASLAPSAFDGDPPEAVHPERAGEAACRGYARWSESHPFPTCFVCGPEREPGDGLRVFPGALDEGGAFAAHWTPDEGLADEEGLVAAPYVWASLDCPTSAPVANFGEGPPIVLARFTARVEGPVAAGRPHAIVSWPIAVDGRKRTAGSALFDADGRRLARAKALWIELRPEDGQPEP